MTASPDNKKETSTVANTSWNAPTKDQIAQAERVQAEIIDSINLYRLEGLDPRTVLCGLGLASADLITTLYGNRAVPLWHRGQADLAEAAINEGC